MQRENVKPRSWWMVEEVEGKEEKTKSESARNGIGVERKSESLEGFL